MQEVSTIQVRSVNAISYSYAVNRNRRHFPEPFLWEMFYHMVEAASAMLNGPKQPNARGYPPWTHEIVHRDIKPGNS